MRRMKMTLEADLIAAVREMFEILDIEEETDSGRNVYEELVNKDSAGNAVEFTQRENPNVPK
jgi:hypothetical protein